jgi:hypothetical protein
VTIITTAKSAEMTDGATTTATSPPVIPPIVVAISSVIPNRMFARPSPT